MKDYSKLRGRIVEKYGKQTIFAEHINCSKVTVSNKLSGKSRFDQLSMKQWGDALDIPLEDYGDYFFTERV